MMLYEFRPGDVVHLRSQTSPLMTVAKVDNNAQIFVYWFNETGVLSSTWFPKEVLKLNVEQ